MLQRVPKLLVIAMSVIALSTFTGSAAAQEGEETLTAVCIQGFEEPIHVEYLTDAQIAEIEGLEQDPNESPVPQIVGFPDPATGSCATENGELMEYDPDLTTPICVPSGPRGETFVVQFVANRYLPSYENVILADPETGACPDGESTEPIGDDTMSEDEPTADETGEVGNDADDSTTDAGMTDDDTVVADHDASEVIGLPNTGSGIPAQQDHSRTLFIALAGGASLSICQDDAEESPLVHPQA